MSQAKPMLDLDRGATCSPRPPGAVPPRRARIPALYGASVLIVENHASSAKKMFLLLHKQGCDVRLTRSADEALALLSAFRPRLMVVNLVLPAMSGLLLVQQLKIKPDLRHIPIVAATLFECSEIERIACEAGCVACIQKPIDPATFADTVAVHLTPNAAES